MKSFLIFSFSSLHGYFHLADSLWPGFGSGVPRPKAPANSAVGPGLDRGYPTDVAVSVQQRLTRIEETTNNVAKKKMAGYLRLVTLIRRQTLRLASPGPESQ